jgi:magnesium chelatase subunit H
VPPYGRAGLYLELANLKELVDDYRTSTPRGGVDRDLLETIHGLAQRSGMLNDVPFTPRDADDSQQEANDSLPDEVGTDEVSDWIVRLNDYLNVLQDRLFSSGLHSFGSSPTDEELDSYLEAYFGDTLSEEHRRATITKLRESQQKAEEHDGDSLTEQFWAFLQRSFQQGYTPPEESEKTDEDPLLKDAFTIASLLSRSTEEIDSVVEGLNGGYIRPAPGGDLLRDGPSVLPTGRNIHALDPYRMPSQGAWVRGQRAAEEIIRQHREANGGAYPQTVAVTLWGLDSIKTRGESIAIVLALIGAKPVTEGTGRIVRYDLVPLKELGRPRIDVLASLSGIFR